MLIFIYSGDSEEVEWIMRNKENIDARDNNNNTALILAAKNGNSRDSIRNHPTEVFEQIFFFHSGNQEIVNSLLKNGAEIENNNNKGDTALIWAARNGNF